MGKPRNTRKYLKVKKIPGNTRTYFSTLVPDPNPTRYPVFCPIPDPILKNPTCWALDQRRTEIINPKVGPPPVSSCHDPPPSTGMYDQFRAVPLLVYRTKNIQLNIFFNVFQNPKLVVVVAAHSYSFDQLDISPNYLYDIEAEVNNPEQLRSIFFA